MDHQATRIFIIGGTGAQGIPVIRGLVKDKGYSVLVLTRDPSSERAQQLLALGNVELLAGTFTSETALRKGFGSCDGAFVNIDGFNAGEKTEIFWAMRAYELALEEGVKFFVYGNLEYVYKKSGYDPQFRTGHYDGKGRVGEWILEQNKTNAARMGAALFTTGPYIEMVLSAQSIMTPTVEDGVVTWRVPLGKGAVAHVALEDCEHYVRWLFDHPERANGFNLEVAIDHIPYHDLAQAFEAVTGHPARYIDTHPHLYWTSGPMGQVANVPSGYNAELADPATLTIRQNFTGFWNIWRHSAGTNALIKRDYGLLDEIHPHRIKSARQWFERQEQLGQETGLGSLWERVQAPNLKPAIKLSEDKRQGIL